MTRLFVAVWPSPDVHRRLAELPRPDEPGVRWVPPAQWHVTLRFVGDASVDDVDAALRSCAWPSGVRAEVGPRVSRLGRSVVCLPVAGLDALARAVIEATDGLGTPPEPRPWHGHLTLARLRNRAACGVAGTAFTAAFDVQQVDLVQSTSSAAGSRYEVLATYPVG
jgi:2'-5' RNA ligase